MESLKKFLITAIIFLIGFSLGISIRFSLFLFLQTKLFAYKYIYKELIDLLKHSPGGANSPEEAWLKYLDAMKKENIDEALLYVWPQDRDETRAYFLKVKEHNLLNKVSDCDRNLIFVRDLKPSQEPPESDHKFDSRLDKLGVMTKEYRTKCKSYKEIDVLFSSEKLRSLFSSEEINQIIEKFWKDQKNVKEMETKVFIRYNPYTKKWFI